MITSGLNLMVYDHQLFKTFKLSVMVTFMDISQALLKNQTSYVMLQSNIMMPRLKASECERQEV